MTGLTIGQAVILGVVEGITEYLPISSTGHLIITAALLDLDHPPEQKSMVDAFNIVIQGGAILAVLGLYWTRVVEMIRGLMGRQASGLRLARNLFIAFLPAAFFGVLLADAIEERLFRPWPVIIALALGGVVMLFITPWQNRMLRRNNDESTDDGVTIETLSWQRALAIGLLQCVAMWPGTSRSMMTIVGGMLVGLRPRQAAEFSFLLGLPTLGGACVYTIGKDMMGDGPTIFEGLGVRPIVVGIVVATVSAAIAIKWLVGYLATHGVAIFGWYRIAIAIVLAIMIWRGMIGEWA